MFKSIKLNLFSSPSRLSIATLLAFSAPSIGLAATTAAPNTRSNLAGSIAQAIPTLPPPDFPATPYLHLPNRQRLLPPPQEILPKTPATPNLPNQPTAPGNLPAAITIKQFKVTGSTVFTPAEIAKITAKYINRPLNFAEILQVSSEITQLYVQKGYVNSGAYIPGNQAFETQNGTIEIKVLEGRVEDIVVTGTKRLNPNYIKSRIGLGTGKVLKIDRLIESLQLLQLDPLIKSIGTELVSGEQPGTSVVQLKITESPNWQAGINFANNRTPSVGEIQTQVSASQNNVSGLGDGIGIAYGKSEASNTFDLNYTLPLNPNNGTLRLQYSNSNSKVIEAPFDRLDIKSAGQDIGLTYRQPIFRTPAQEFALGATLARRETNTGYLQSVIGERIGYPSPGADDNGSTRVSAARLFQDYTIKDTSQVFAVRSQFSFGVNALNSTISASSPDSKFFTWRGQAQYVRSLASNSIFVAKVESQLADRPLLALEQIGVGGQDTVRGYRQDLLLADSGVIASAEARFPIFTPADSKQIFQFVPFFDFGYGWNKPNNPSPDPTPSTIASAGLGLRYQGGDNFTAKLDYGIPFTNVDGIKRTGQEKGFYFSLNYNQSF